MDVLSMPAHERCGVEIIIVFLLDI